MSIDAVSSHTPASQAQTGDAVAISVQKKAQEIEKAQAQALIEAIPEPISTKGAYIDVKV